MKSVASALVLVASVADVAVPVLVAPAVVFAVATAARAEPAEAVRHQVVRYDDLNLASPAGQAAFKVRLKGAVQAVCGPQADMRNFDEAADYKACVAKAAHDAMSALPQAQQQAARPSHAG
ncbi:MAG: UrcA family protein [Caulobacteraceae bacterium]